ncbi:MAG TPA: hypothetical protein VGH27_18290 [Streptosporangiaceae bacterium]|jgi:hypothetical protein
MTSIEERLADAMNASYDAARALPLRPLTLRPSQPRRWVVWFAPVAAALAVVAVVTGLNALTGRAAAPGPSGGTTPPVVAGAGKAPRYYVDLNYNGQGVVRSVATGKVTDTVPSIFTNEDGAAASSTTADGVFYIAGFTKVGTNERIYRFSLTSAGKVTGLTAVAAISGIGQIDAMAVSPDGAELAVSDGTALLGSDRVVVISLATGTRQILNTMAMPGYQTFHVSSLSWAKGHQELVFTGLWCSPMATNNQVCMDAIHGIKRLTEVRAVDPATAGGQLSHSRLLLRPSATYPDIVSAQVNQAGSIITAMSLSGPVTYSSPGTVPSHLTVEQFSAATGQPVGFLYQGPAGPTVRWLLSPDASGEHWLVSGAAVYNGGDGPPKLQNVGFNGEISHGKLINLPPSSGEVYGQTW